MKRSKRRYLLLQIDSDGALSQRDFLDAAWGSITKLYGESGASCASLLLINFDEDTKRALVRVSLDALQPFRASLALITRIADREAAVHVVKVSGTIKSLREKAAR